MLYACRTATPYVSHDLDPGALAACLLANLVLQLSLLSFVPALTPIAQLPIANMHSNISCNIFCCDCVGVLSQQDIEHSPRPWYCINAHPGRAAVASGLQRASCQVTSETATPACTFADAGLAWRRARLTHGCNRPPWRALLLGAAASDAAHEGLRGGSGEAAGRWPHALKRDRYFQRTAQASMIESAAMSLRCCMCTGSATHKPHRSSPALDHGCACDLQAVVNTST